MENFRKICHDHSYFKADTLEHDHCFFRTRVLDHDHSYAKPPSTDSIIACRASNLALHPKKLDLVSAVKKAIVLAKPSAVCLSCGKILYGNQISWVKNCTEHLWRAQNLIPLGCPVKIEKKFISGVESFSCCRECSSRIGKKEDIWLFDNFGDIPDCVKTLKSYHEYRKLAIGSLFCSTFKPPGYTYLHNVGDIWFNKDPRIYRGMVGIMYEGNNKELKTTNKDVITLRWLRRNNTLYRIFFSNVETIVGHFEPVALSARFASLPTFTPDLKIAKGGQISVAELKKQEGLIFPAEKFVTPNIPVNIKDVQIGEEVLRDTAEKVGMAQDLSYSDEFLEAKLFPHLFPHGTGSWYLKRKALTIGKYHKMRLLHADRRWANDRFYPFFTFDRNIKQRLFFAKNALATNRNRQNPLQASNLKSEDCYYKYGSIVPTTVPGSNSFWTNINNLFLLK